ncbi:MAG: MFS transporter [Streptosporangiales bacterium]|nr:MFS transporter [Streptosporangiales bacterium]
MLVVSMAAQITATVFLNVVPFFIPHLHLTLDMSLAQAGLLASAPIVGNLLTLFAWGVIVDRIGERLSITIGLGILAVASATAGFASSFVAMGVFLLLGGMGGGSINSASGRLIVGWFPPHRRGTAMGIRQASQPVGVGITAAIVPSLVDSYGVRPTLLLIGGMCFAATVLTALLVVDPPRPSRAESEELGYLANPYRRDSRLLRIHSASILLVVPQFTIWTFTLVWLVDAKEWSIGAASALVAVVQLLGAFGRVGAGVWSDRVRSRLGPMRIIAAVTCVSMLALALLEDSVLAIALAVVASVVTVSPNALAFTSVAEIAGPSWSGRAMGTHNTGQLLVASAVAPLVGAAVTEYGYALAFAAVAIFPLLAVPLVPVRRKPTGGG